MTRLLFRLTHLLVDPLAYDRAAPARQRVASARSCLSTSSGTRIVSFAVFSTEGAYFRAPAICPRPDRSQRRILSWPPLRDAAGCGSSGQGGRLVGRTASIQRVFDSFTRSGAGITSNRAAAGRRGGCSAGRARPGRAGYDSALLDGDEWIRFEAARRAISQQFGNSVPAPRYRTGAPA